MSMAIQKKRRWTLVDQRPSKRHDLPPRLRCNALLWPREEVPRQLPPASTGVCVSGHNCTPSESNHHLVEQLVWDSRKVKARRSEKREIAKCSLGVFGLAFFRVKSALYSVDSSPLADIPSAFPLVIFIFTRNNLSSNSIFSSTPISAATRPPSSTT